MSQQCPKGKCRGGRASAAVVIAQSGRHQPLQPRRRLRSAAPAARPHEPQSRGAASLAVLRCAAESGRLLTAHSDSATCSGATARTEQPAQQHQAGLRENGLRCGEQNAQPLPRAPGPLAVIRRTGQALVCCHLRSARRRAPCVSLLRQLLSSRNRPALLEWRIERQGLPARPSTSEASRACTPLTGARRCRSQGLGAPAALRDAGCLIFICTTTCQYVLCQSSCDKLAGRHSCCPVPGLERIARDPWKTHQASRHAQRWHRPARWRGH